MGKLSLYKGIKVLEVGQDYFIGAKGYSIYKYSFANDKTILLGSVQSKYAFFAFSPFIKRLLRAEINNLYTLENGDQLVIAKKGLFRKSQSERHYSKCFDINRGSKPLNLCITPSGDIYWGEYFQNINGEEVNIYHSSDNGVTWNIAYTFPQYSINHVHGLFWDSYSKSIWIATGDRGDECIIANTSDGFKTINTVFQGKQEYRATVLLFYPDCIIYGTDSQYMQNEIRRIDRTTHAITTLQKIQGSAIKAGQIGEFAYLSTTVEPSDVNTSTASHLWISENGNEWRDIFSDEKDILPSLFQYGSIEFPIYKCPIDHEFMFSGRALKETGGNSVLLSF